jgi:MFS transporter, FSR family, fosmidomycin resistance protein
VIRGIAVLLALIFSKYVYLTSLTSYYTFYLIEHFSLSVQAAQMLPVRVPDRGRRGHHFRRRDRRSHRAQARDLDIDPGRSAVHAAAAACQPVLDRAADRGIGLILASAFPAILVYAQELVPGKVGMISGLFFGLAFGAGGIGAAWLGALVDATSLTYVYRLCAYLPLIGLLAAFLPDAER